MSLKGSQTEQNLKDAFAGESQANRRYLYFAAKADVVMESDRITIEYGELANARRDLRALAANNASTDRPRGLLGWGTHDRMTRTYETHRRGGRLPATIELVFAHAWRAPEAPAGSSGPVEVPFSPEGGRR